MKVKILESVNDRTVDGRVFAMAGGVEHTVDDGDEPMVALMRNLEARGFVKIAHPEPKAPAEVKKARTSTRAGESA